MSPQERFDTCIQILDAQPEIVKVTIASGGIISKFDTAQYVRRRDSTLSQVTENAGVGYLISLDGKYEAAYQYDIMHDDTKIAAYRK